MCNLLSISDNVFIYVKLKTSIVIIKYSNIHTLNNDTSVYLGKLQIAPLHHFGGLGDA